MDPSAHIPDCDLQAELSAEALEKQYEERVLVYDITKLPVELPCETPSYLVESSELPSPPALERPRALRAPCCLLAALAGRCACTSRVAGWGRQASPSCDPRATRSREAHRCGPAREVPEGFLQGHVPDRPGQGLEAGWVEGIAGLWCTLGRGRQKAAWACVGMHLLLARPPPSWSQRQRTRPPIPLTCPLPSHCLQRCSPSSVPWPQCTPPPSLPSPTAALVSRGGIPTRRVKPAAAQQPAAAGRDWQLSTHPSDSLPPPCCCRRLAAGGRGVLSASHDDCAADALQ